MTRQASDNPVFYVQYVAARTASLVRNARDLGVPDLEFDPALLTHEKEGALLRALAEFPRVVAAAAQLREPHRVARYLEDTASAFHKFYDACRVLPQGDEEFSDLHRARLVLVSATRTVLPERPRPARRDRARADVSRSMRAHEAGWAHAAVSVRGPSWLREPEDPNVLVPQLWSSTARKRRRRARGGRRRR